MRSEEMLSRIPVLAAHRRTTIMAHFLAKREPLHRMFTGGDEYVASQLSG
jgi:hypothetical protein